MGWTSRPPKATQAKRRLGRGPSSLAKATFRPYSRTTRPSSSRLSQTAPRTRPRSPIFLLLNGKSKTCTGCRCQTSTASSRETQSSRRESSSKTLQEARTTKRLPAVRNKVPRDRCTFWKTRRRSTSSRICRGRGRRKAMRPRRRRRWMGPMRSIYPGLSKK